MSAAQAPKGPAPADLAARGRVRPILIHPGPMLRQVCAPCGKLDRDALAKLAGDALTLKLTGIEVRIARHGTDHPDGHLILDRPGMPGATS